MTATQLIEQALRDLSELRTGQHTSDDILADCLNELNQMLDEWALERLWPYAGGAPLTAFASLATDYALAPGGAAAIRKALAVRIHPQMKLHLKSPLTAEALQQLSADAAQAKQALLGVAP